MAEAYTGATGDFADRLLATLDAAEAAGGDIRGRQSAALVISPTRPDTRVDAGTALRLQVEDHDRPLVELRRLVDVHHAYKELAVAQNLAMAGEFDGALPALDRAFALAPDNTEINFWRASMRTMFGDPQGRPDLDAFFIAHPTWREFVGRLVAAGVVPDTAEIAEIIAGPSQ